MGFLSNITSVDITVITTLLTLFAFWLDIRRLRSDVPEKRLSNFAKSLDLLQEENEFLRERETHYLDYINYVWLWIESIKRHLPKRKALPKVFENFIQRKRYNKSSGNSARDNKN